MGLDGLFYLLSVVGIAVVMWWVVHNDGTPVDGRTTGLLAMRESHADPLVKRVRRRKKASRSSSAGLSPRIEP